MNLSTPQPKPQPGTGPDIGTLVLQDIQDRIAFGMEKYGQPLRVFDGRDHLADAYAEQMDQLFYIRQEIEERNRRTTTMSAAVLMPVPAMMPVREALAKTGIVISFGDTDWKFQPETTAKKHFWSVDGSECLWCAEQRSADQVQAWRDAGEPKEACKKGPWGSR